LAGRNSSQSVKAGNSFLRGRLSTVDLLEQTSLDMLLVKIKQYFFQNKLS